MKLLNNMLNLYLGEKTFKKQEIERDGNHYNQLLTMPYLEGLTNIYNHTTTPFHLCLEVIIQHEIPCPESTLGSFFLDWGLGKVPRNGTAISLFPKVSKFILYIVNIYQLN